MTQQVDESLTVLESMPLMQRAMRFATNAHKGQTRSDKSPYIGHPMAVAQMLWENGLRDPEIMAVAYLHDTIEDCGVTEEEVCRLFGIRVARGVVQLTNMIEGEIHEKAFGKPPWSVKHAALLEHCRHMHDDYKCVKLADRIHNLEDSKKDWKPKRLRRYARAGWEILQAINPPKDDVCDLLVKQLRETIDSIIPLAEIDSVRVEDDVQE